MHWTHFSVTGFLIFGFSLMVPIESQHTTSSSFPSSYPRPQQQQKQNQALSIQEYNRLMSIKVACDNLAAANLSSDQFNRTVQTPELCRDLRLASELRQKTSSTSLSSRLTPTASISDTTLGYADSTINRQPDIAPNYQRDPGAFTTTDDSYSTNEFGQISVENAHTADMSSDQSFVNNIYQLLSSKKTLQNIVYSPIALQSILALIYTGSTGKTASELRLALGLPLEKAVVFRQFDFLRKPQITDSLRLQIASKLFYNKNLSLNAQFLHNAAQYFTTENERVEFANQKLTAQSINQWVASRTNGRILDLIQPETLEGSISAILVNAIYFKAKWVNEFSSEETRREVFALNIRENVTVEMMNNEDMFGYIDSNQLGAEVLQLPYKVLDLSMLIVLPHEIEGLADVERRLKSIDLRALPQQMQMENVKVQIPKFRFQFQLDMVEILRELQISDLFSDRAELSGIFNNHNVGISKAEHKAFIDVNEAGSEAAASTFNKLIPLSLPTNLKYFKADHPFMFAILSPKAVYFMGHVVKFS